MTSKTRILGVSTICLLGNILFSGSACLAENPKRSFMNSNYYCGKSDGEWKWGSTRDYHQQFVPALVEVQTLQQQAYSVKGRKGAKLKRRLREAKRIERVQSRRCQGRYATLNDEDSAPIYPPSGSYGSYGTPNVPDPGNEQYYYPWESPPYYQPSPTNPYIPQPYDGSEQLTPYEYRFGNMYVKMVETYYDSHNSYQFFWFRVRNIGQPLRITVKRNLSHVTDESGRLLTADTFVYQDGRATLDKSVGLVVPFNDPIYFGINVFLPRPQNSFGRVDVSLFMPPYSTGDVPFYNIPASFQQR